MRKKILAFALAGAMGLAACGGSPSDEKGTPTPIKSDEQPDKKEEEKDDESEKKEESDGEKKEEEIKGSLPDSLANANLTIVWDMTEEAWKAAKEEDPDAFNLVWTTKEEFEKKYGGKVEIIGVGWGDQASTVISMVNAGEVCDLAQAHDQNFPIYGAKNIVQDISQYIDLNDGFWYDSVTKAFTYNGKPYAAGADAAPVVISYNKTLFEQNGIKTPMEYFNEGNWNWDTFRQVALDMTGDTDGDGNPDVFGFGWWDSFYVQMLNANGTVSINYDDPNGVSSNYLSPQATEAFTFLQNGYITDKFMERPDGDKFISNFKSGKLAMTCEYSFAAITAYPCDYEIEWAPLPTGPSGEKYECGGSLSGFAIPVTSQNPEGAAVFARMAYELLKEHNTTKQIATYGQEEFDLMQTLAEHINFAPIGIEKYWDANWTIFSGMIEGTPVSTFATNADEQIREGAQITLGQ